jgi:hypothetical protein
MVLTYVVSLQISNWIHAVLTKTICFSLMCREIDEALRPGVYALIDSCSADDLQYLHSVFGGNWTKYHHAACFNQFFFQVWLHEHCDLIFLWVSPPLQRVLAETHWLLCSMITNWISNMKEKFDLINLRVNIYPSYQISFSNSSNHGEKITVTCYPPVPKSSSGS